MSETLSLPAGVNNKVSMQTRIAIVLTIGILSGSLVFLNTPRSYFPGGDFAIWPLRAARDLLNGDDPYDSPIFEWVIPYPLTAALTSIPFAPFRDDVAGALFIGLSSALMAFGLTWDGKYWRLFAFTSVPYIDSVYSVQFSPLLVAAAIYPILSPAILIKPNVGLSILGIQKPSKSGVTVSVILLVTSFIIDPVWPFKWWSQIDGYTGYTPILLFAGPLLLLTLLRWREPEARLLLLMAIMPKRSFYDHLLLWLIPKNRTQMLYLSIASWISYYAFRHFLTWNIIMIIYFLPLLIILTPIYKSYRIDNARL